MLTRLAGEIAGLGKRLGGVLVQLPPSLVFDRRTATSFFATLRRRFDVPLVVEARHASCFEPALDDVWTRHAPDRVAADPVWPPLSAHVEGAAPVRYWRLHGCTAAL